jgi:hypothetical protein
LEEHVFVSLHIGQEIGQAERRDRRRMVGTSGLLAEDRRGEFQLLDGVPMQRVIIL